MAILDEDEGPRDPDIVDVPSPPPQSEDTDEAYEDAPDGLQENEDGSVDVDLDDDSLPVDETGFYDNLVPTLMEKGESSFLDNLSLDLIEKIEDDIKSWEDRDKQYATGIKRTGLGNEAPGGAQFQGASRAVHPLLMQATVDFEARAMKELFPATGPVKSQIIGTVTKKRAEKAERISRCMNWQTTKQIKEYRPGMERGLMQAGLNGAAYKVWRYDHRFGRPAVSPANADKVIIPATATDFYSAERITFIDDITELEYKGRCQMGLYVDLDGSPPSMAPDKSEVQKAIDKVEGKENQPENRDGLRRTYMVNTYLSGVEARLAGAAPESDDGVLPYIVYVCDQTYKVLGLVRNWEEQDDKQERMHWISEIPFVPWETGGIGLIHMIGGLAAAATGSLRALLDSAHVNNVPTAAYLKGATVSGQSKVISPTQLVEIAGGIGADDIRKVLMPMPYNEPSTVLYQLLGFVVEAGKGVIQTTFENLSENNTNLPVGTAYALIEQGLTVVSSIMGRQHYAMYRDLEILFRINRMYLEDDAIYDEAGEVLAYRSDFQGPMDVVPVSDPSIPSDAHRMAQTQALAQRADVRPNLYNQREVEKAILSRLRIPEAERYLVPEQTPTEMNAANENMAATLSKPIMAFPEQDHISHLQAHLDFLQSPFFGFLSIIAPTFIPAMLNHIREHLVMWYVTKVYESLQSAVAEASSPFAMLGADQHSIDDFIKMKNVGVRADLDKLIAVVSDDVLDFQQGDAAELQQLQLIQVVQKAQEVLAQYQQPIVDPAGQTQVATAQIRANVQREGIQSQERTKVASLQLQREKNQGDQAMKGAQMQGEEARRAMEEEGQDRRMAVQQTAETDRAGMKIASEERMNQDDNITALTIAQAEIKSGEKVAKSTGGDSSPGR